MSIMLLTKEAAVNFFMSLNSKWKSNKVLISKIYHRLNINAPQEQNKMKTFCMGKPFKQVFLNFYETIKMKLKFNFVITFIKSY